MLAWCTAPCQCYIHGQAGRLARVRPSPARCSPAGRPFSETTLTYLPRHSHRSEFLTVRGLRYHLRHWSTGDGPLLLMVHGWMDVSASFQFVVDRLGEGRRVVAPDWRGFGLTQDGGTDSYWFADYLGDLDAIGEALSPDAPFDLVGHSMGGNVAMLYAGVRPGRVRRLVNLEGFGLRQTEPAAAVGRYRDWLDGLKKPAGWRLYPDLAGVAAGLMKTHPRLSPDKAAFLAPFWSRRRADGQFEPAADPAHRRVHPVLYRLDEVLACWREITAPVCWVTSDADTELHRFTRTDAFRDRLRALADCREVLVTDAGHMLHHDQPEAVARLIEEFLR